MVQLTRRVNLFLYNSKCYCLMVINCTVCNMYIYLKTYIRIYLIIGFLLGEKERNGVSSSSESLIGSRIICTRFVGFGFLKFSISMGITGALGETVTLFTDPSLFRLNNLEGLKSIFLTIFGFGFLRTNTNKITRRKL